MKFCKDCKYCQPSDLASDVRMGFAECVSPKNAKLFDRVNGQSEPRYKYCSSQRSGGWLDAYITKSCGPQARWFEKA